MWNNIWYYNKVLIVAYIISLVAPQISPFNFGDETLNAGDAVSLTCTVNKGDFPLTIYWNFNGEEMNSNNGIIISRTGQRISVLSIESVQAIHKGNYTCIARNSAGTFDHTAFLSVNGSQFIQIV